MRFWNNCAAASSTCVRRWPPPSTGRPPSGHQCQRGEGPRPPRGLPTGHLSGRDPAPHRRRASGFFPLRSTRGRDASPEQGPDERTILTSNWPHLPVPPPLCRRRSRQFLPPRFLAGPCRRQPEPGPARTGLSAQPRLAQLRQGLPRTWAGPPMASQRRVPPPSRRVGRQGRSGRRPGREVAPGLDRQRLPGAGQGRGADGAFACLSGQRRRHGSPHHRRREADAGGERHQVKRRRCGRKRRPCQSPVRGRRDRFKEFKIVTFYDDGGRTSGVGDARRLHAGGPARCVGTRAVSAWTGRTTSRGGGRFGVDQESDPAAAACRWTTWAWTSITCRRTLHQGASRRSMARDPKDEKAGNRLGRHRLLHTAKHEGTRSYATTPAGVEGRAA